MGQSVSLKTQKYYHSAYRQKMGNRPKKIISDAKILNATAWRIIFLSALKSLTTPLQKPTHECGVFAVYNHPDAAMLAYYGLLALAHQHDRKCPLQAAQGSDPLWV